MKEEKKEGPWRIWFKMFDENGKQYGGGVSTTGYAHKSSAYRAAKRMYGNRPEYKYKISINNPDPKHIHDFEIKGISLRIDNTFYVDVNPSTRMWLGYFHKVCEFKRQDALYKDEYEGEFLNVAYNIEENTFELSSFFSEHGWCGFNCACTPEEEHLIKDFVMEWKERIPENPNGEIYIDDTLYTRALSDDIPWKIKVLR